MPIKLGSGAMILTFLALVSVLLALILVSLWVVLYQLMKQQGRMLLRLDTLEVQSGRAGAGLCGDGGRSAPQGLEVGTPFGSFHLPDLEGRQVRSDELPRKRTLLVHWSPNCGFCKQIASELARLQGALSKREVSLVFISHGDTEAIRSQMKEHSLEGTVLVVKKGKLPPKPFRQLGTPVAYLLDEERRVAEPLAVGAEQVPELAREAAGVEEADEPSPEANGQAVPPTASRRPFSGEQPIGRGETNGEGAPPKGSRRRLPGEKPLSQSKLERNGLKAGTPAPSFRRPDISGREVALDDYRGRSVLLVFSDPRCGPCELLAPELARLDIRGGNNLAIILISRGDLEENRQKARQHGYTFPVVRQKTWEISKEFGIFATPVAFLIGEDGVIAHNVARGVDEILTLAARAGEVEHERAV
jgi:peroxiredoxin